MTINVLVIGAGLSGAIVARELANYGKKVLILEKRDHIGGNIYDKKIDNINVHCYGPHIFHTDDEKAYSYMNKFWTLNNYENKVEALVQDKLTPIPFNFTSIDTYFPKNKEEIKDKLINEYGQNTRISILDLMKSNDSKIQDVANFIYENIFKNYTIKMWGISPEKLGDDVMKRVPVSLSYSTKYFKNKYEGIPKDGYTNTVAKIIDHKNIYLRTKINAKEVLTLKNGKIYYKNALFKGLVVYSGPIDELFKFKFGILPYRSLSIDFRTIKKESYQKTAVVNYPSHPKITRISEYKKMTNDISKNTIISIETPGAYNVNSKLFHTPYYPITTNDGNIQYAKYAKEIKKYDNLIPVGRLATFKYINMDTAISLALELSKKIIKRLEND